MALRPIRVGISGCLLGNAVRFDGGHKRDGFIAETLGRYVEWMVECPEMELGLGTFREALRLVGGPGAPRLVFRQSGGDITEEMRAWAGSRLDGLARVDLCGHFLKSDSTSCGMERVRVYGESGTPSKSGVGIFARTVMDRFPVLPVEEEGRLHALPLRENFIERGFGSRRYVRDQVYLNPPPKELMLRNHV